MLANSSFMMKLTVFFFFLCHSSRRMNYVGQLFVHDETHSLLLLSISGIASIPSQRSCSISPTTRLRATVTLVISLVNIIHVRHVVVRLGNMRPSTFISRSSWSLSSFLMGVTEKSV